MLLSKEKCYLVFIKIKTLRQWLKQQVNLNFCRVVYMAWNRKVLKTKFFKINILEILHSEKIRSKCAQNQIKTFINKQKIISSSKSHFNPFVLFPTQHDSFQTCCSLFSTLIFFSVPKHVRFLYFRSNNIETIAVTPTTVKPALDKSKLLVRPKLLRRMNSWTEYKSSRWYVSLLELIHHTWLLKLESKLKSKNIIKLLGCKNCTTCWTYYRYRQKTYFNIKNIDKPSSIKLV